MARYPEWYSRLDEIRGVLRTAESLEWLGRHEIRALFDCSDRDSIRLLHKFGATERDDALAVSRAELQHHVEAIAQSSRYETFFRHRQEVARQLTEARKAISARELPVRSTGSGHLDSLPETIIWRRQTRNGAARFSVTYEDGADLLAQLANFLMAVGLHREEFFEATEPDQ